MKRKGERGDNWLRDSGKDRRIRVEGLCTGTLLAFHTNNLGFHLTT